jgi:hypothetical protein
MYLKQHSQTEDEGVTVLRTAGKKKAQLTPTLYQRWNELGQFTGDIDQHDLG